VEPMSADDLIDRTLYHLVACEDSERIREAGDLEERVGPKDSSWADLLAAIMEGFERGWINEARLFRERGTTHLVWNATDTGTRAMDAYRRRVQA
jgi:hypothetical protein